MRMFLVVYGEGALWSLIVRSLMHTLRYPGLLAELPTGSELSARSAQVTGPGLLDVVEAVWLSSLGLARGTVRERVTLARLA
jgi:hypothetical protein